jgi:hypothetical protein
MPVSTINGAALGDTSGNVGIGTNSPNNVITTYRGAGVNNYIQFTNATTGTTSTDGCLIGVAADDTALRLRVLETAPMIFTTSDTERMRITSAGDVGIGTNSPAQKLVVSGAGATTIRIHDTNTNTWDITNNSFLSFTRGASMHMQIDNTGKMFFYSLASGAGTNALRWSTATGQMTYDTSSARYKDNIRNSVYGLSHVMQMRSAQFEYKDDGRSDVGLIAEELQPIVPELVGLNKDGQADSVSYDRMVSVLVKAVQELKAELDTVKTELATLKGQA